MTSDPHPASSSSSSSSSSSAYIKHHRPYFTPLQVARLSAKQRGKLSVSREERLRQQACGFLDAVGLRCGFPRKTIATAQTLYMRFHLFFPYQDFNFVEVALSTLYVSSKLHDTLKKPRDIILASYPLRFPQLVKRGALDPSAIDPHALEGERKRVLGIERLVLETMCFKFGVGEGLRWAVKLGRKLGCGRDLSQQGWRVAVDCHRTPAPLSFPAHTIALASLFTASLLLLESTHPLVPATDPTPITNNGHAVRSPSDLATLLSTPGPWEADFASSVEQVDEVAHHLLDLYTTILSLPPTTLGDPSPVSPKDPSSPAHHSASHSAQSPLSAASKTAFRLPGFWTAQTLTELKIHLRDRQAAKAVVSGGWVEAGERGGEAEVEVEKAVEGMGKNDGTVRFVWDAQRSEGEL